MYLDPARLRVVSSKVGGFQSPWPRVSGLTRIRLRMCCTLGGNKQPRKSRTMNRK